jgi:hypothetical protein|tara:strand:+ start:3449 stop:4030 length:582 start_codon:yes stop_codon:yes gene_type:complete
MSETSEVSEGINTSPLTRGDRKGREAPWMFAVVALPLIEKYGDEAKELIYDIRYREGHKLGEELGSLATCRNDLREFHRLLIEEMNKDFQFTVSYDDPNRDWQVETASECSYTNRLSGGCEMDIPNVWIEMGLDNETISMLGNLHCRPYNLGLRKGFNPNIDFRFEKFLPDGDDYCEPVSEVVETAVASPRPK